MVDIKTFQARDPVTIRANILRTLKNGMLQEGFPEPNVGPTGDFYKLSTGISNELAVMGANCAVKCDEQMPDTAEEGLPRITKIFDLAPQPASGSVGSVLLESSANAPIATDAELTDELGQRFKVQIGGTYANGALIPIEAISVGAETDHDAGDVLSWVDTPPYCSDKVLVAAGGLINGAPADDVESLRGRLYARLQNPSGSGNPQQVAETAEASTASVQKAFVEPAITGPSSCAVAVTAAPTTTNKSREVATSIMNGTVRPFTQGALPQFGILTVTTVEDVDTDVAFAISLPDALTANPPGPGGGWVNGTTWPRPDGVSVFKCAVTGITNTKVITVDAATPPTVNVSRIAWLSPTEWKLYTALVIAVTGTSGAYVITLDKPLVGITVGCLIWPGCQNAQDYVDAVLGAYALMGPGEKTSNASALARAFRHPPPSNGWPYAIDAKMLDALTKLEEVSTALFLYRSDGTTTVTGTTGTIIPQVPATLDDPPRIFVPKNIAFYRLSI